MNEKKPPIFKNPNEILTIHPVELRKIILKHLVEFYKHTAQNIDWKIIHESFFGYSTLKGEANNVYNGTISYLIDKGFINKYDTNTSTLTSNGIDEVENGFPILNSSIKKIEIESLFKEFFMDLHDEHLTIEQQLKRIEKFEFEYKKLENSMILIQEKILELIEKIPDRETKSIFEELASLHSISEFGYKLWKAYNNPKSKNELKQIGELLKESFMELPEGNIRFIE